MKSTYKLFGVFWEHKESGDIKACRVVQLTNGFDYKMPFCLFDLMDEYRTIGIKELLSVENETEFDYICSNLRNYTKIALLLDYATCYSSKVASIFYLKKLSQIYYALQTALPECDIVIATSTEKTNDWIALQEYIQ